MYLFLQDIYDVREEEGIWNAEQECSNNEGEIIIWASRLGKGNKGSFVNEMCFIFLDGGLDASWAFFNRDAKPDKWKIHDVFLFYFFCLKRGKKKNNPNRKCTRSGGGCLGVGALVERVCLNVSWQISTGNDSTLKPLQASMLEISPKCRCL